MNQLQRILTSMLIGFGLVVGLTILPVLKDHTPSAKAQGAPLGRYIVLVQAGVNPATVASAHGILPEFLYTSALNGFAGVIPLPRLNALLRDPRVVKVEPDRVVTLVRPTIQGIVSSLSTETLPTGVNRIDADLNPKTDVSSIGIAIIDTGIYLKHEDLNIAGNVTFVPGTKTGNDDNGHGTHVAGIAAAKANDKGVRGVAPNARLYAVKVLDRKGSGFLSWVIKGIDWVTQNASAKGIKVANMSLGFQGTSDALNTAISNSVASGITYTVAAGNSATDASTFSPANHPDVIAVSAIADSDGNCGGLGGSTSYGADDSFATFSNYGSVIDIAAPGVDILSTYPGNKTYPNGRYATLSGTSMAAPHVAGAAALLLATNSSLTPSQVRDILTQLCGVTTSSGMGTATPQTPRECNTGCGGTRLRGGFSDDPDSFPEGLVDAADL